MNLKNILCIFLYFVNIPVCIYELSVSRVLRVYFIGLEC